MTNFNLDQEMFPKLANKRKLTDLVCEGFSAEGPFLVKAFGGSIVVYEKARDRDTLYILTNKSSYLTYIREKIKRGKKV